MLQSTEFVRPQCLLGTCYNEYKRSWPSPVQGGSLKSFFTMCERGFESHRTQNHFFR